MCLRRLIGPILLLTLIEGQLPLYESRLKYVAKEGNYYQIA